MKNLALKRIQKMKAYCPPINNRRNYQGILLDFNECTRPTGEKVTKALEVFAQKSKLHFYPEYFDLEKKISAYAKVLPEQVMVTNGSDQGIDLIFRTFTGKGDKVIIPSPSFAMFYQCSQVIGNKIVSPKYNKADLSFPLREVLKSIDKNVKIIVVCNPNNPTGTLVKLKDIEKIAKSAKNSIIYIDEAYFEYSGVTAIGLIKKYPNIIISRTFSKAFGLPSLRIGYIIARPEYIKEMIKVRGPYDVNMAAYYAAKAVLKDQKNMKKYIREVMKKAKPMVENFFVDNKITFFPSSADFILYKSKNSKKEFKLLRENGILTRPQDKINIEGTIRVSIGTVAQMKKFMEVYKKKIISRKLLKN